MSFLLVFRISDVATTANDRYSALGRYDGRVYEDLYNRAHRLNPLNRITFNPNYWDEEIVMGTGENGRNILSKL